MQLAGRLGALTKTLTHSFKPFRCHRASMPTTYIRTKSCRLGTLPSRWKTLRVIYCSHILRHTCNTIITDHPGMQETGRATVFGQLRQARWLKASPHIHRNAASSRCNTHPPPPRILRIPRRVQPSQWASCWRLACVTLQRLDRPSEPRTPRRMQLGHSI